MTRADASRVLYVIVCAAGPAADAGRLAGLARESGWTVQIIATPSALAFIDIPALEAPTGRPVRSQYRSPGEPKTPPADAIIVAPATYNTINKWANGVSDTYALGILASRGAAPRRPVAIATSPLPGAARERSAATSDAGLTTRP